MRREALTPELDEAIRMIAWLFGGAKVEIDSVFRPVKVTPEQSERFAARYKAEVKP